MRRIRIKWQECNLAWGWAYIGENLIQLDPRVKKRPRLMLEIAAHEVAHLRFPDANEEEIDAFGKSVADVLWRLGYRLQKDG